MASFAVQKLFDFIESYLFIYFSFIAFTFDVKSKKKKKKKSIAKSDVREITLRLSSRNFIVSVLKFNSLFCVWCKIGVQFNSFDQFSQHHLLKSMSFHYYVFLVTLLKINLLFMCDFHLQDLHYLSLFYVSVFMPTPYCFDSIAL